MYESLTIESLHAIRDEALASLSLLEAVDVDGLEAWRVQYVGRRGLLTLLLREIGSVPIPQRREIGAAGNAVKSILQQSLDGRLSAASGATKPTGGEIDITLSGRHRPLGRLHPTTRMVREITNAFRDMGFQQQDGPEVEWERYNFDLLNIPKDHPSRDLWDSIWLDEIDREGHRRMLLRTHTSPVQARVMEQTNPPVRIVVPGRCARYEATDATHEWHFFQVEGLAVDEGITFTDLKGTLFEFARRIFGAQRRVRFRCDFFPFVEPGVDMSIDCFSCDGQGCSLCSQTGWIEILGAGMVHPQVLRGVGYDPERYTGFAFGMGVERIAILKYGIDDIRNFYSNDLRFLSQF